MSELLTRRGIIGGLVGIIAAPAIVRATSLMPIKTVDPEWLEAFVWYRQGGLIVVEFKVITDCVIDGQHRVSAVRLLDPTDAA